MKPAITCGFGGPAALALCLHTQPLAYLPGENGRWWKYEEIFGWRSRMKWSYHC